MFAEFCRLGAVRDSLGPYIPHPSLPSSSRISVIAKGARGSGRSKMKSFSSTLSGLGFTVFGFWEPENNVTPRP